jgi:anaerobic magnesium-protoporphyrin IX monomethyl ester cyclase
MTSPSKILFVEPPKEMWFVMGEYLPPPLGILELAAYLEKNNKDTDIKVLDCQAEGVDWKQLEKRIESFNPDIIAPSALATCNVYTVIRTLEIVKRVNPNITTVVGGQHFTALAHESLEKHPEIDVVVRGEGEQTLSETVRALETGKPLSNVEGISFRHERKVVHTPNRPLIENLDDLPFPGYHFVEEHARKYHFKMMIGANVGYTLVEASRGCPHRCVFCSQWKFWGGKWRAKTPKRIVDEIECFHREFGSRFMWLTDDNLGLGEETNSLCDEIIKRGISDDIMWFIQARCDDICNNQKILPKLRKSGLLWILTGLESHSQEILNSFHKDLSPSYAKQAVDLLKKNDIFAQATMIIGNRKDSHESIQGLREFANEVDPDLAIYMILSPFPGTDLYETAKTNGWIEDENWANYDMAHAIMPTESLSRQEIQEEFYECYRSFYGSMGRRMKSLFSPNSLKRRTYRHLASQGLLKALRDLF